MLARSGRNLAGAIGALAALASERIIVGRFMTLADAVRDHEGRTAALSVGRRPHDEALYERLRQVGDSRISRSGH
jgi:hypothetical protein